MDSSEKEAIPKEANTVLEEQEPEKQMEVKEMEENKDLVEEEKTEKESEETKEYIVKSKHFAGLTNVGATCYMNSLLQTLFMTPEFRQSVYRMSYLEGSKERAEQSIPIQMLLLFTRLQQSSECVSTRPLIKSFGWGDSEAFQQHDVQEFNRVLFDALKQSLEPEESQFISHLYEGTCLYSQS
jgi:ubiquitin carboxyl-terminal hydrolase 47